MRWIKLLGAVTFRDGTMLLDEHFTRVKNDRGQTQAIRRYCKRLGNRFKDWHRVEVQLER